MKHFILFIILTCAIGNELIWCQTIIDRTKYFPKQEEHIKELPPKEKVWVFIMAGQSNMAGRGIIEPNDTIPNKRILSINNKNEWIYAKEPLHFYQPKLKGLDCGMAFATELLTWIDSDINIALIPCAVGGSSIDKWLNNVTFNNVQLQSNLKEKIKLGQSIGEIKAVLWHQGESDADSAKIMNYEHNLKAMYKLLREYTDNAELPILTGHLGTYADPVRYAPEWKKINKIISKVVEEDPHTYIVNTADLKPNNDKIHFNAISQRILGKRFAQKFKEVISSLNSH